jgi:hypothetical protein
MRTLTVSEEEVQAQVVLGEGFPTKTNRSRKPAVFACALLSRNDEVMLGPDNFETVNGEVVLKGIL